MDRHVRVSLWFGTPRDLSRRALFVGVTCPADQFVLFAGSNAPCPHHGKEIRSNEVTVDPRFRPFDCVSFGTAMGN